MRFRHVVISLLAISALAAVVLCSSAPAIGGSNKAVSERSCSGVARQLRALHLRPIPVYPGLLPSTFRGASATVSRSGFDFSVDWSKATSGGVNYFAVSYRRGRRTLLSTLIHDRRVTSVRRVRISKRRVYVIQGDKAVLAWHEQGRTYFLLDKYATARKALKVLRPFVRSLRSVKRCR
jgi:hypothetical protein